MEIKERDESGMVILDIIGEIDLYNAPDIKSFILKKIENQKYNIIINLQEVSYIDSSGIGALISSLSNLKKYQGFLKITNIHDSVKKVFELTKLTSFFEIFPDVATAIKSYHP
jgi:anti-sigma B factor antagonist